MINALFGYTNGLGMGLLTFDWSMIAYTSSPLVTPVSLIFPFSFLLPLPEAPTDPLLLYRRLVVGRSKRLRLSCYCLLDHCPHSVLYAHSHSSPLFWWPMVMLTNGRS